jgi:hypothetical protein
MPMPEPPDLETLARRYLDLWQDQVSALAADPEFTETLGRLLQVSAALGPAGWMSLWTAAAAGLQPQKGQNPHAARPFTTGNAAPARAAETAGPAPAAASPGDGNADLAELRRRLAVLEERLGRVAAERTDAGRRMDVAGKPALASDGPGAGRRAEPRARRRRP